MEIKNHQKTWCWCRPGVIPTLAVSVADQEYSLHLMLVLEVKSHSNACCLCWRSWVITKLDVGAADQESFQDLLLVLEVKRVAPTLAVGAGDQESSQTLAVGAGDQESSKNLMLVLEARSLSDTCCWCQRLHWILAGMLECWSFGVTGNYTST